MEVPGAIKAFAFENSEIKSKILKALRDLNEQKSNLTNLDFW